MKKSRQKTNDQTRSLRAQDLAAIYGGDSSVLHGNAIASGGQPTLDGALHPDKWFVD
jgi:hypothetical protein